MKNPRTRIYVRNRYQELDIYLDVSGISHYLTSRRRNGLLYLWLKNGQSISELARLKPQGSRIGQKKYHHAQQLLKLAEDYLKHKGKGAASCGHSY